VAIFGHPPKMSPLLWGTLLAHHCEEDVLDRAFLEFPDSRPAHNPPFNASAASASSSAAALRNLILPAKSFFSSFPAHTDS
jgi:hypothetical protein